MWKSKLLLNYLPIKRSQPADAPMENHSCSESCIWILLETPAESRCLSTKKPSCCVREWRTQGSCAGSVLFSMHSLQVNRSVISAMRPLTECLEIRNWSLLNPTGFFQTVRYRADMLDQQTETETQLNWSVFLSRVRWDCRGVFWDSATIIFCVTQLHWNSNKSK